MSKLELQRKIETHTFVKKFINENDEFRVKDQHGNTVTLKSKDLSGVLTYFLKTFKETPKFTILYGSLNSPVKIELSSIEDVVKIGQKIIESPEMFKDLEGLDVEEEFINAIDVVFEVDESKGHKIVKLVDILKRVENEQN